MKLPTHKQCLELLDEHNVPDNVRKHSFAVNKVAVFLAKKLKEKGIRIDVELVDRASLLHDLDKIPTLGTHDHGKMTREILSTKGYPELGRIIHNHLYSALLIDGLTWEEKIVNYSDKRCTEDNIVTLDSRVKYIKEKYAKKYKDVNEDAENRLRSLETEIFSIIGLDPEKLGEYIGN